MILKNGDVSYVFLKGGLYRVVFVANIIIGKVQRMLMQTIASNPRVIINFMISCNVQ